MPELLYYALCTEREGSWQRPDGFLLSEDKNTLQIVIDASPKWENEYSWEYDPIKSFMPDRETYLYFMQKMRSGVFYGDNRDLPKLKDETEI